MLTKREYKMENQRTKSTFSVKELTLVAIFTAITSVLASIVIPLPFTPIPISFGMVAVYLSGMFLTPRDAVYSQICYLILGVIGMPVFSNYRSGFGVLFGPTGGCLMVYPLMAAVISFTLNGKKSLATQQEEGKPQLYIKTSVAIIIAICIEYLGGALWLTATTSSSFYAALTLVCFPFIPLDIVKIVFTVFAMLPLRARLIRTNMLLENKPFVPHKKNVRSDSILKKALAEETLSPEEANILMDADATPIKELLQTAETVTRRHFGNKVSMCAIYPAKVGHCSGDCAYCAQSAHNHCDVVPVKVNTLNVEEIIQNVKELRRLGVGRYSLVTSGEHLTDDEFDDILHIFQRIKNETDIGLCASLGSLTPDRAVRLKDAGVSRYHHNIETSRSFFPKICSTHSFDDKIATIDVARKAGMEVCCGGIIAMGETAVQRAEMVFALKKLDIDCVPINILNPIPGTRLEKEPPLSAEEILRTIAVFRLILPNKTLRFAGGREKALGQNEYAGYTAGINAMLVGNYLTTPGKSFEQEIARLEHAGLELES